MEEWVIGPVTDLAKGIVSADSPFGQSLLALPGPCSVPFRLPSGALVNIEIYKITPPMSKTPSDSMRKLKDFKVNTEPSQTEISWPRIQALREDSPRRICFETSHQNALRARAGPRGVGFFSVPFLTSFYPIFFAMTRLPLFESNFKGYWRSIRSEEEFTAIRQFIDGIKPLVFLKDALALSVALSLNMIHETGKHTQIGDLEYRAKYKFDMDACAELTEYCSRAIQTLPFYNQIDSVCAVPSSDPSRRSLPQMVAHSVTESGGLTDYSSSISWAGQKPSLKNLPLEAKWQVLTQCGLRAECEFPERVILIDDMYQSGTTMHFVAMNLLESGVKQVFGLALVKSLGDSDNQ